MIYLGADHRGFKLKEELKKYLETKAYRVEDIGTYSEENVDYPFIAVRLARKVTGDPNNRGVLLCGSGAGVCIVANKIKGIRAAEVWDPRVALAVRREDNVNVVCLPADSVDGALAKKIVQNFLDTSFSSEDRYKRRLKEIEAIEREEV